MSVSCSRVFVRNSNTILVLILSVQLPAPPHSLAPAPPGPNPDDRKVTGVHHHHHHLSIIIWSCQIQSVISAHLVVSVLRSGTVVSQTVLRSALHIFSSHYKPVRLWRRNDRIVSLSDNKRLLRLLRHGGGKLVSALLNKARMSCIWVFFEVRF